MKDKYYFDDNAADSAVKFIETYVRHVKGEWAGQHLILEDCHKKEIIEPLFGWKNTETGLRRYRKVYVEIPRKNAKSMIAACIVLLQLFVEDEPGAEIYGAAASKEQARIVFEMVRQIIEKEPELMKRCKIYRNSIVVGEKFYQAVSKDSHTQHGYNCQCAVVDELHAHKDGDLLDTLETSMGSRRQPLTFVITTAGDKLGTTVWGEQHKYAKDVQAGIIKDETLLVVIFAADEEDDPFDEETWKKANPMYGISVKPEYIRQQAERAKHSVAFLNTFKRLHLNIPTNTRDAWIHDHVWDKSALEFESDIEKDSFMQSLMGKRCYGGLDLALTSDISAFSLLFDMEDGTFVSLNWFWLPTIQGDYSSNTNNRYYSQWVEHGHIIETPGEQTDFEFIMKVIVEANEKYNLVGVGYDPAHASAFAVELDKRGVQLFKHRSGAWSITEAFGIFENWIISGVWKHVANPVLSWMANNVRVVRDQNGNTRPDRSKATEKIDGILSNVYCGMTYQFVKSQGPQTSYLETRPLFTI